MVHVMRFKGGLGFKGGRWGFQRRGGLTGEVGLKEGGSNPSGETLEALPGLGDGGAANRILPTRPTCVLGGSSSNVPHGCPKWRQLCIAL